jgi:hypothetical protein
VGADGTVEIYDYEAIDDEHRKTYGKSISEDWPWVTTCQVSLPHGKRTGWFDEPAFVADFKTWIIRYLDTADRDSAGEFYCEDIAAHERVIETLEKIGPVNSCTVWT